MRKEIASALCAIIAGGTLSVAVGGFQGRGGQEGPKVARIEKVKDNLYYIFEPASGGNSSCCTPWHNCKQICRSRSADIAVSEHTTIAYLRRATVTPTVVKHPVRCAINQPAC